MTTDQTGIFIDTTLLVYNKQPIVFLSGWAFHFPTKCIQHDHPVNINHIQGKNSRELYINKALAFWIELDLCLDCQRLGLEYKITSKHGSLQDLRPVLSAVI